MAVNEALRKARMQRYWTQSTLAAQLNTTRITVVRWEQGKAVPSLYFREQLCKLFNMTAQELGLAQPLLEPEPKPVWQMPEGRNPFFSGRVDVLQRVHQAFQAEPDSVSCHVQVISGSPGIGKTQIAIEYAYRFHSHYTGVLWLRAETQEMLVADMRKLAAALSLPQAQQDVNELMDALRAWLEATANWLLIIDDVEDFTLVNRLLLACASQGHALITTRMQAVGRFSCHLRVKEMERDEGALLLLRRAKLLPRQLELTAASAEQCSLAREICGELEGLPLALDRAGSYIEETGCSLMGYRDRFRHHYATLLSWHGQYCGLYPYTVNSIMQRAEEKIGQRSPVALEILRFCVFLSPRSIPEKLITASAPYLGPFIRQAVADLLSLDEAFIILNSSGLLWRDPITQQLTMHRLVQIALREHLAIDVRTLWVKRALQALKHLFSKSQQGEEAFWLSNELLLPHILVCLDHLEHLPWGEQQGHLIDVTSALLPDVAHYLLDRAEYDTVAYHSYVSGYPGQLMDSAYLKAAMALHTLALLYQKMGKYSEAEEFISQEALLLRHHPLEQGIP